jgi:hypothetical protein
MTYHRDIVLFIILFYFSLVFGEYYGMRTPSKEASRAFRRLLFSRIWLRQVVRNQDLICFYFRILIN